MTTMYKRFKRWQRTRTYQAPIDWFKWFFTGTLPLCIGLLIWGMTIQLTLLNIELDATQTKTQRLERQLQETELMLAVCLNGGTPAYVDEEKHRVYIECPTRAKERIYS